MDGAGAAEPSATAVFRALQIDGVAQDPKQRRVAVNIDRVHSTIDVERIGHNQPRHSMSAQRIGDEPARRNIPSYQLFMITLRRNIPWRPQRSEGTEHRFAFTLGTHRFPLKVSLMPDKPGLFQLKCYANLHDIGYGSTFILFADPIRPRSPRNCRQCHRNLGRFAS